MADDSDKTQYHLNIPVKVAASGILDKAVIVYGVILSFWNTTRRPVNATDQYLADLLNTSTRSISRSMNILKANNYVTLTYKQRTNGSKLRLVWPLVGENGESINSHLTTDTRPKDTKIIKVEVLLPRTSPTNRREKVPRPNPTSAAELIGLDKWRVIGDVLDEYDVFASEPETRLLAVHVHTGATPELVAEAIKQSTSAGIATTKSALRLLTDWQKQGVRSLEQLNDK